MKSLSHSFRGVDGLSASATDDDVDIVLRELPGIVTKLRKISTWDPDEF